jgi:hypothetical protein
LYTIVVEMLVVPVFPVVPVVPVLPVVPVAPVLPVVPLLLSIDDDPFPIPEELVKVPDGRVVSSF